MKLNVNETLIRLIADKLDKYRCHAGDLVRVLLDSVSFEERQQRAIRFIAGVLTRHGKEHLCS